MKKIILSGMLLSMCFGFAACGTSNSFEFKTTDIKTTKSEGSFAIGKVVKGTLKDGEVVTIKRDGKTIKSVKVQGLLNKDTEKEVKSISKDENAYIGLGDIGENDISVNDMIVK